MNIRGTGVLGIIRREITGSGIKLLRSSVEIGCTAPFCCANCVVACFCPNTQTWYQVLLPTSAGNHFFLSVYHPLGETDQASCLSNEKLPLQFLIVFLITEKKRWLMSVLIPRHIDGLINYMFSWTPAVSSTHSQTNFLLRCSKATANLHIYLMLFKKISRFLIYYLVSFSCFTCWSSISTRMMMRSPAKNTYH